MQLFKFMRNHFALFFLAALAVSGVVYIAWAIGANVNCIAGTCSSTNGNQDTTSPYDSSATSVFTGENDTASIECAGGTMYQLGGGNDVAYLRNPQTASLVAVTVQGESGDDVILSQCTNNGNSLQGGDGNDFIAGDAGDRLYGHNGNDLLAGGQDGDALGDVDGNGACGVNESDPNNDIFIGGPGLDTYCTAANDGDDIVIIHAGDVPAGNNNEPYTCQGNDTILMFGFNRDGVLTGTQTITDPVNNPAGDVAAGARYTFTDPGAGGDCTIIFVE